MTALSVSLSDAPQPAAARTKHGKAWLEHHGDVRLLKVEGSFYEMGRQHGVLLRQDVLDGPLPYFRTFVERILRGSLGPAAGAVWPILQRTLGRNIANAMPPFAQDTLRGLTEGAGLRWQDTLDGATMPDAFVWLVARVNQISGRGPAVAHRLALALELGCTSALAWGDATSDGKLLHARNFDYHGVESWAKTKAVVIHQPDEGMRYLSVAAAGIPMGGVTAMNEAGLTLTVHQHMFSTGAALGGMPIGVVGDIVMREAHNLDEAQRILEAHRPIGCWTYIIADGHAREVLCFEENPKRRVAMRIGPQGETTFGYANIYLDPELGATESNLFGSYWRHNQGRHARVNALLDERSAPFDPQGMAEILGDAGVGCRVSDSIAMALTVGSVVFAPEDGLVWVGTGEAPTSHGVFEPFNLMQERRAPEVGCLKVGDLSEDPKRAFEHFRRAYLREVDHDDRDGARVEMERAVQLAPEEPLYHSLLGMLALGGLDATRAEAAFDRALSLGHPHPERMASFHLWRGRARDLQGRRDEARQDYRATLGHYADEPVHRAAKRGLRRRYRPSQASKVHPEMGLADVTHP